MIIKVTMTRDEMTKLRLDNKLSKTLVIKLIRAGVVLEASVTDVNVDYAPHAPTYRIVGLWEILEPRMIMGSLVSELRIEQ